MKPSAKQRCYFHLFTELVKVDKRNAAATWKRFRKKLARLLKDAVRLDDERQQHSPLTDARQNCINASTNSSPQPSTMPTPNASSNACVATAANCSRSSTTRE